MCGKSESARIAGCSVVSRWSKQVELPERAGVCGLVTDSRRIVFVSFLGAALMLTEF